MSRKRTCKNCGATTRENICDFYKIGWHAYKLGKEKSNCYCGDCYDEMIEEMQHILLNEGGDLETLDDYDVFEGDENAG